MKRIYTTFTLLLAFGLGSSVAMGQTPSQTQPQMQPQSSSRTQPQDSTLLSERVEGNYLVRRYLLHNSDSEAQYTLDYTISASRLPALTAGNATELAELDKMIEQLKQNPRMHVSHITITGYASPDGNPASNEALALSRAQQFRALLDKRYSLPSTYKVLVEADAEPWKACEGVVQSSSMADKDKVMEILSSSEGESLKEQQLKAIPKAWSELRSQILPPMRRVVMTVYYNTDTEVEIRTLIEKPKPASAPAAVAQKMVCPCEGFVDDETIGIVVDMSDPDAIY